MIAMAHPRRYFSFSEVGAIAIRFPAGTLDEILKLDELCMLASWLKGLYKCPEFISESFGATCRAANPAMIAA